MLAFAKQAYQIYLNNQKAEEASVAKKPEEKNGAKKTNRRKNK